MLDIKIRYQVDTAEGVGPVTDGCASGMWSAEMKARLEKRQRLTAEFQGPPTFTESGAEGEAGKEWPLRQKGT